MIEIRPIRPPEWVAAKHVIYRVAHEIFHVSRPFEDMIESYESNHQLKDMDDIQGNYFDNGGIFLVLAVPDEIIGTGAIRRMNEETCELKRLWLLTEHHGKGLGYRMIQELLAFARQKGYRRIRLETDPIHQKRAYQFYKRLGFYEVPMPEATDDEDILMEMAL